MELLWVVFLVVGVVAGLKLIQFIAVLTQLLRMPFVPLRVTPLSEAPVYCGLESAAIEELEALGFRQEGWTRVERGPIQFDSVFFQSNQAPAFAELTFLIGGAGGFVITFYSFDVQGQMLATTNRTGWGYLAEHPGVSLLDAYADSLQAHWSAHLARIETAEVIPASTEEAHRRISAWTTDYFDRLRSVGAIRLIGDAWYPTFRAALGAAWEWFRVRGKLARPYASGAISGEHESEFHARFYQQSEAFRDGRGARRDVKLGLLAVSATASLLVWGWLFGWGQAIALLVILFVHEMGHALAMRVFGYRDMQMVFLPLVGAAVTGAARDLAGWKRAVILLAGPVPGLVAGIGALLYLTANPGSEFAFDWQMAASMAVFINLFNLLPISPLDGGQLFALSLGRWPRLRLGFVLFSAAAFFGLAFWLEHWLLWLVAALVAVTLPGQWRVTRLGREWREGLREEQQLRHLFQSAQRLFHSSAFQRQYGLVKAVLAEREMRPARTWESGIALVFLVALWGGVVGVVLEERLWVPFGTQPAETRTPQQIAFDDAYDLYRYEEDDAPTLDALVRQADALMVDDPRRIDTTVESAISLEGAARQAAFERVLLEGRTGLSFSRKNIAEERLWYLYRDSALLAPEVRAARLQEGIDRIMQIAPELYAGTIAARLRVAEAIDQAGDPGRALELLETLERRVRGDEACRCEIRSVIQARANFHLSHQAPALALAVLEGPPYGDRLDQRKEPLALDYAWALLASGRNEEGVAQMRLASYSAPFRPSWAQRLKGARDRPPRLYQPLDVAYALVQDGQLEEARQLVRDTRWACWREEATFEPDPMTEPWQTWRERSLWEVARSVCPQHD